MGVARLDVFSGAAVAVTAGTDFVVKGAVDLKTGKVSERVYRGEKR